MIKKLLFILLFAHTVLTFASPPSNFEKAKKIAGALFSEHKETLYCGCRFNEDKEIDLKSCHMEEAEDLKRAHEVEWEHIVPASHLGQGHACWKKNLCVTHAGKPYHGRTCCRLVDGAFRKKEAELYNLWPANGEINVLRQNYEYSHIPFSNKTYGCSFIIDKFTHLVEPDDKVKGTVARASLFMAKQYNIEFDSVQQRMFEEWDKLYPPNEWEKAWAQDVADYEGYTNPFITRHA